MKIKTTSESFGVLRKNSNKIFRGFTLIELLVVIAIISLLVSILLPSLKKAKELALISVCLTNGRNLTQSLLFYASEHDGQFPEGTHYVNPYLRFENLYNAGYVESPKIFICPTDISNFTAWIGDDGLAIHCSYRAESPQPLTINGVVHWVTVNDCNSLFYKDHWGLDMRTDQVKLLYDDNGYTHGGRYPEVASDGHTAGYVDGHVEFLRY